MGVGRGVAYYEVAAVHPWNSCPRVMLFMSHFIVKKIYVITVSFIRSGLPREKRSVLRGWGRWGQARLYILPWNNDTSCFYRHILILYACQIILLTLCDFHEME